METYSIDIPKQIATVLSVPSFIAGVILDVCLLGLPNYIHADINRERVFDTKYDDLHQDIGPIWWNHGFAYLGRKLVEYSARLIMAPIGAPVGLLTYPLTNEVNNISNSYSQDKVKQKVTQLQQASPIQEKNSWERFTRYNQSVSTIERDFPLFKGFRKNIGNASRIIHVQTPREAYEYNDGNVGICVLKK